jgi:hypothetical protein
MATHRKFPIRWLALLISLFSVAQAGEIRIEGESFRLDEKPFKPWGIRVASGVNTEEDTQHLLDQLDDYQRHGLNSLTVFYQGSSGGYSNPFSADGSEIDPACQSRLERVIRAADDRGMMVIVGIFYQRAKFPFRTRQAVREVVRRVTQSLQPYRNVVINIANEQNSGLWKDTAAVWDIREPSTIIELCRLVNEIDPKRIVGGGGYDHPRNEIIGRSPDVDVLLFDTKSTREDSADLYQHFRDAGVTGKPIVNVETFGAVTRGWMPQGVFPDEAKRVYRREVEAARATPGLSVFFHNNPWCQGPDQKLPRRYDLGGQGTKSDPGIRWYFEMVREAATASDQR